MKFGVLKDIKNGEFRVIATPTEVGTLVADGNEVYVASGACARDGFLRRSLTAYRGYLTHEETSGIQDRPWIPPETILKLEGQPLDPAPKTTVTRSVNYYEDVHVTL